MPENVWTADVYSFTKQTTNHIMIDHRFLSAAENILIIDDFLANGQAVEGLLKIANDANANVVGVVIEKTFQKGRQILDERGVRVESLARIKGFENDEVIFL